MWHQLLRAKIHRATVTGGSLEYEGSLTVDEDLLDVAGILPYELVMVSNLNTGERFNTYVIPGTRSSGDIVLNGPTARKGVVGDKIIIFCYSFYDEEEAKFHRPKILLVDSHNRMVNSG